MPDGQEIGGALVRQYRLLKRSATASAETGAQTAEIDARLDQIYGRIVESPVTDLAMAVEKLLFAHLCMTEEADYKEAAKLVLQVCRAFDRGFSEMEE